MSQEALKVRPGRGKLNADPKWASLCLTCGTCASGCPVTGVDGMDPRKAVRMAALGLEDQLIDSRWPWICTLCGRCELACPMGIEIVAMTRTARSLRERDKVPGPIHKGVMMNLERGNNLGIPRDDFLFLLYDVGKELEEDGCPGFHVPIDKKGARVITTINSKEPFGEPEDMMFWWRIWYAAKEDWTVSSTNWEGVNWGLFSGDDPAMKEQVSRVLENARRLEAEVLLLPE
jgi:heterodisulfide reductase subunit C